jgi:hypothetical protein
MLICAMAFLSFGAGTIYPQTDASSQDESRDTPAENSRKSGGNPAPGTQIDLNGAKIGVMQSRNPFESGINARSITSRAFVDYIQIDINGGLFLPMGDLATGMDYGYSFGVNIRSPFTHVVLPSQLGENARYFRNIDIGLHFSYLTGESSRKSSDTIAFAPLLLDIYYSFPFDTGKFKVYLYNGQGVSLASTVVVRNSSTVHAQSFSFTLRPGIGAEYFFSGRVYGRMSAGYFICMESVLATGVITSFGVGYLF